MSTTSSALTKPWRCGIRRSACNRPTKVPLAIVVGGAELPLMLQQSADYAEARSRQGLPALLREIPGANHFSILDEMERSDGLIVDILRELQANAGL